MRVDDDDTSPPSGRQPVFDSLRESRRGAGRRFFTGYYPARNGVVIESGYPRNMRNFILASAVLAAAASFSRADDGVVIPAALDEAPALNAPMHGPAFIDPVFPAESDDKGGEFAVTSEAPLYLDGELPSVLDADEESPADGVASNAATDDWLELPR